MTFALDDSGPEDTLKHKKPADFYFEDWLHGFLVVGSRIDLSFDGIPEDFEYLKDIAIGLKYVIAYLYDFELNYREKGGNT